MILGFEVEHTHEFTVLRDYYMYNKNFQGVVFVLRDEESSEVFSRFLPQSEMNNVYKWTKAKKEDKEVKRVTYGIEEGEESKLIIETGYLRVKGRFSKKEKKIPAKKYRYTLFQK